MRSKSNKKAVALSSEDVSSMAVFKSVLNEAGSLRNHACKRKIHELAFSPLLMERPKEKESNGGRRSMLESMINIKIGESLNLDGMHKELFERAEEEKKEFRVGKVVFRGDGHLTVDMNHSRLVTC